MAFALVLHKLAKAAFSATAAFAPSTHNHQNHSGRKLKFEGIYILA